MNLEFIETDLTAGLRGRIGGWTGAFPHVTIEIAINEKWPSLSNYMLSLNREAALRFAEAIRTQAERLPIPEIEPAPPPEALERDEDGVAWF